MSGGNRWRLYVFTRQFYQCRLLYLAWKTPPRQRAWVGMVHYINTRFSYGRVQDYCAQQIAHTVLYPIGPQLSINSSSRKVMEIVFSLTLIPHLP